MRTPLLRVVRRTCDGEITYRWEVMVASALSLRKTWQGLQMIHFAILPALAASFRNFASGASMIAVPLSRTSH